MYNFIVQFIFILSLAILVYLLARALPRVADEVIDSKKSKNLFDGLFTRLPMEKLDINIHAFLIKGLRKTKVLVSKFDNGINGYLDQLKKYSAAQEEKGDLKEKMDMMANGKDKA